MSDLYIGLMSGTSMDAVDAVLVRFQEHGLEVVATHRHVIPSDLRDSTIACRQAPAKGGAQRLGELDVRWGQLFGVAVMSLLESTGVPSGEVRAVGSHGQTLLHHPTGDYPFSLQLGDPNRIVEQTAVTTVAGFRGRDLAAGGQGAPLAPAFHAFAFASPDESRVVLNIGGIANITLLPADAAPAGGFDTGPGNTLLDHWCMRCRNEPRDTNGDWAATGNVDGELLDRLLDEPYFRLGPPKSTGQELFNMAWLEQAMGTLNRTPPPADVQATLSELTARTILDAVHEYAPAAARILVCGGGIHNKDLMARLGRQAGEHAIDSTAAFGLDPDWVEAVAFAWLARQTLAGLPGNLPAVTGADRPVVLGAVYHV